MKWKDTLAMEGKTHDLSFFKKEYKWLIKFQEFNFYRWYIMQQYFKPFVIFSKGILTKERLQFDFKAPAPPPI